MSTQSNRLLRAESERQEALVLRIPRRLESPNIWQGRHWRVKHRISQEWQREIEWAVIAMQAREFGARAGEAAAGLMKWGRGRKISMPVPKRMRVGVSRFVPSRRHFIRDDDNLRFAVKPLFDALKRLGYIHDDSREWLEHNPPMQNVSPDGTDLTLIVLEAIE